MNEKSNYIDVDIMWNGEEADTYIQESNRIFTALNSEGEALLEKYSETVVNTILCSVLLRGLNSFLESLEDHSKNLLLEEIFSLVGKYRNVYEIKDGPLKRIFEGSKNG
jgi:hypothetical protein